MTTQNLGLIIVAAGSSRRMEGVDKVWALLGERPVLWYSVTELAPVARATVLVVRASDVTRARAELNSMALNLQIVTGGAERQESVANGLAVLPSVDAVAIHDAARPLTSRRLLENGMDMLERFDGAVPVERVHDTIKRVSDDGVITATIDRGPLRAAQTPQIFHAEALRVAYDQARVKSRAGTDDAILLASAGYQVTTFPGLPSNFKITTPYDLHVARLLVRYGPPT